MVELHSYHILLSKIVTIPTTTVLKVLHAWTGSGNVKEGFSCAGCVSIELHFQGENNYRAEVNCLSTGDEKCDPCLMNLKFLHDSVH